jgi:serine/threonine-protein kinase RIO1
VAARLRTDLDIEPKMVHGRYGEFNVLVDEDVVVDGGKKVILGIMPTAESVVDAVRAALVR